LGIITSAIFQRKLHQSITKLPEDWKSSLPLKTLQRSAVLLLLFQLCSFLSESISDYLAFNKIYNSYIFSIYFTVATVFLFGFLFINTQNRWKRYAYCFLYAIIIGYLIQGKYYDPHCVLPANSSLLIFSSYFLAAFLHLTDLLLVHKSTYFDFQLKINLSILVYSLICVILTSFYWAETMEPGNPYSRVIFYLHALNIILFYLLTAAIFTHETLKLRRG